jgi:acyl-CoA hydrolase
MTQGATPDLTVEFAASERESLPVQTPVEAHLDEWVSPQQCDERGHLRAGQILEWMDVVGALAAARHARRAVVTASVDGVELAEPISLGERVTMTAQIAYTSERSMGVAVTMTHGTPGMTHRATLQGWMTFVAVNEEGQSVPVPPVMAESAQARARYREGVMRREFRSKLLRGELTSDPIALPQDSEERRLLVRELLKNLPRLRWPWEAGQAQAARSREDSYVHTIMMVRSDSLNFHGTLYGGVAMRWLENNAQLSARAYLGGAPVRCSGLHGLTFLKPARSHTFVHLRAMVVHVEDEQLTVLVTVESERPSDGAVVETLRAFLSYEPSIPNTKIPKLECHSEAELEIEREVGHRLALQRSLTVYPTRQAS